MFHRIYTCKTCISKFLSLKNELRDGTIVAIFYSLLLPKYDGWQQTTSVTSSRCYVLSNTSERFITAHVVATKNKGLASYHKMHAQRWYAPPTRIWASKIPATRSLASTIYYSSGGSYSLAFVSRNEFIHDILLAAIKSKKILLQDISLTHDNTRRTNCKWYMTINFNSVRR